MQIVYVLVLIAAVTILIPLFSFTQCSKTVPDVMESKKIKELVKGQDVKDIEIALEKMRCEKCEQGIQCNESDIGIK